ncbi:UDP-N-acetylmuramate dehydrogenase [Ruminiclostridium cellulolyticum]|uniref:UDP-N-acetylenolpyruvoylglucosamine reductase n=1 Tax=Ruminiclostridium cellulolyticum (strain ATCC 35319 / DSM 5812 / JCM 6584 / H10) TaxID=394503 RepID=B8I4X4_RUMCH|nr:UDP-N-acetylenolpyruvoylglucosamine reductase [Ruminiclostridium cellulolyticum H10]
MNNKYAANKEECVILQNEEFVQKLVSVTGKDGVSVNEPMSAHTSFKIGGPADIMTYPENSTQLGNIIRECIKSNMPFMVMGNGTNLLVSDKGIRGVVIKIYDNMSAFNVENETIELDAGILVSKASKLALEYSLTGLEFAEGIPGTVGGAVTMNAGAYTGEMCMVVYQTEYMDREGNIKTITGDEHCFSYRNSVIQKSKGIVLRTKLKLHKGDSQKIKEQMDEFNFKRRDKQPLEWPSAGSVFKRPQGYFVGKLIDDSGLRGFGIGGAKISDKHSGFIINSGGATCKDVLDLIKHIQKTVDEKFRVQLEPELRIIGDFN